MLEFLKVNALESGEMLIPATNISSVRKVMAEDGAFLEIITMNQKRFVTRLPIEVVEVTQIKI